MIFSDFHIFHIFQSLFDFVWKAQIFSVIQICSCAMIFSCFFCLCVVCFLRFCLIPLAFLSYVESVIFGSFDYVMSAFGVHSCFLQTFIVLSVWFVWFCCFFSGLFCFNVLVIFWLFHVVLLVFVLLCVSGFSSFSVFFEFGKFITVFLVFQVLVL